MNFGIIVIFIFIGIGLYYFLSRGPSSDLIFTSSSAAETKMIQKYLEANGIKTYIKNNEIQALLAQGGDLANPSLHVVNKQDYDKAIELIQSREDSK